jgi:hypothetical protein
MGINQKSRLIYKSEHTATCRNRLFGRVVKAVDSSSTIIKMHAFEPRRSHHFFLFLSLQRFYDLRVSLIVGTYTLLNTRLVLAFST